MQAGICGYPGSGKSTVFSALAPGARSHRGVVLGSTKVPDDRVDRLAAIFSPKKTTYAEMVFVDVGGDGGRGGAFPPSVVQEMRNADALVHVVRMFASPFHSEPPEPARDAAMFNDELLLLDLAILERRGERWRKESRRGPEVDVNTRCQEWLEEGRPLRSMEISEPELKTLNGIQLLSLKPLVTLHNLSEDEWDGEAARRFRDWRQEGPNHVSMGICGTLEAELTELPPEEQGELLEGLGISEPARFQFIRTAYGLLDLVSFLTCGPDECRAWPITRGTRARKAAGKVHSDIERGFIRAEVFRVEELEEAGSEAALKAQGRIRVEGKEYVVQDGDVVNFRFNV